VTVQGLYAAWLSNRAILLAGAAGERSDATFAGTALEAVASSYDRDGTTGAVVVAHLPPGAGGGGEAGDVAVGGLSAPVPELELGEPALRALIRNELSGLDAAQRARILEFVLAALAGDLRGPGAMTLAGRLARLRDALREQLPRTIATDDDPYAVDIEAIYALDHESFWIRGWLHDADHTVVSLAAVSPEGARADLLGAAYRYERLDIQERYAAFSDVANERHGFMSLLSPAVPSHLATGWIVELRTSSGVALEVEAPAVERRIERVRAHLLHDMASERPGSDELVAGHIHPALERIQARLEAGVKVETVIEVGDRIPEAPGLTVIVPLYKRIDFVEHQLAHFARDPEMAEADILYVLDSPEFADNLLDSANALSVLHGISLRIAVMTRNAGFSGANNTGVSLARGGRIVLLNSDVIPDRPGWLGKMSAFYDATPDIGALGPKLLYEDDSLQHAGMYFYRHNGGRIWANHHYFKGMHRSFAAANVARAVPAVTAACMMIDRDLYEEAGGLSHAYVQGGYEDSDLCLRLIEMGRENWYMPGAELYHLEAQSFTAERRKPAAAYNVWLHTKTWNDRIERVAREYGRHPLAGTDSAVAEPTR
jgi:GT2 family glycosyltransferase